MPVRPRPIRARLTSHGTIVMMMTLVMLGLIAGATASGSVVTASSSESHAADSAGHRCKCKSCRSATACCFATPTPKPGGAPADHRPSRRRPLQVQDDAGPCMSQPLVAEGRACPPPRRVSPRMMPSRWRVASKIRRVRSVGRTLRRPTHSARRCSPHALTILPMVARTPDFQPTGSTRSEEPPLWRHPRAGILDAVILL